MEPGANDRPNAEGVSTEITYDEYEHVVAENARLRELVKQAFRTGWNEGAIGLKDREPAWDLWIKLNPGIRAILYDGLPK